ncbi:hypothetical protein ACFL3Q_17860, partial [Planctomycetota bacterium]
MKRRDFLKSCAVAAKGFALSSYAFAAAGCALSNKSAQARYGPKRPNIVFIFIDDMGWRDVGFMGSQYYETPTC